MKKYIISILLLLLTTSYSRGQTPTWSVNENNYQYTMSFVSFLNIDGVTLSSTNDKIAAFVDGECRGVTNLTYVANADKYFAYLTVFSNNNGESMNFKIYDSANDIVVDVIGNKTFEINAHYGDLFQAFSFANTVLNTETEILGFSFQNASFNDKIVEGNQITFDIDKNVDISSLNAVFELSEGAKLYNESILQISGQNSMDFSNAIELQVLSEDQSATELWRIIVRLSTGTASFYKKDAVCYAGGTIKVLFSENNEEVCLSFDDTIISTQTISNGETIFNNLESGTYKVKVGGNVKEITINLKQ